MTVKLNYFNSSINKTIFHLTDKENPKYIYAYWLKKVHPSKFNKGKLEGMDKGTPGRWKQQESTSCDPYIR